MIYSNQVLTMIYRALNLMDARLVNHGVQVAAVMKDMLAEDGLKDEKLGKELCVLALLHDVGAYRLEDIQSLVQVETKSVWEHSIFGYLFLKEFSPFGGLAGVVLYHHAEPDKKWKESEEILHYAQLMHVADRVEIWHRNYAGEKFEQLAAYLLEKGGTLFSKEAVECFLRANEKFGTYQKLNRQPGPEEIVDFASMRIEEATAYLWLMIHAIDFRSRFTVTHTVGVVETACRLAEKMGLSEKEREQIYYGALLHDIGKIGTPVSILEKDGKLTEEEMSVMREHVILSEAIIKDCVEEPVARIALRHHEKLDGSGYPLGLTAKDLTLPERIMAVADIVSALSMSRSYKEAFPKETVFSILRSLTEKGQIDGSVVETVEKWYDDIINEAEEICIPLRKVHERISEEYKEVWDEITLISGENQEAAIHD